MKSTKTEVINVKPLEELRQQERIDLIVDELLTCKPKVRIINEYSQAWGCSKKTVQTLIDEACVYLSEIGSTKDREAIRALNAERLEEIFQNKKCNVKEKIRILDTLNRLYGLYETNVVVSNKEGDVIKFDIGVDDNKN